jgi:dTDP-4-amino-4,6-dideoxygalactose transaminase
VIPLFAPVRQNEPLFAEIQEKFSRILRSGEYILGAEVEAFERELAAKTGYRAAIGCSNGTDAIVMSLRALELPADAEVITPAFSFIASASPVVWAGLKPVFADVDPETANITVETVSAALTPKTRAVIAVDLYGRQAPIADLRQLCDAKGLYLIEDGAQSIGVPAPARGAHLYTTSFYPTKNLGALGDGGAVMTQDPELATRVREISRHGGLLRDHYVRVGTTGRLDAIQAAFLHAKLAHLDRWSSLRHSLASWYTNALRPFAAQGRLGLFAPPVDAATHVWALYTVRIPSERQTAMEFLRREGIGCAPYYPKALPDQPAMKRFARGRYPHAEALAREVLSLPFFPELTPQELDSVVDRLAAWMKKSST